MVGGGGGGQLSSGWFDLSASVVINGGFETDGRLLPQRILSETCRASVNARDMFDSETPKSPTPGLKAANCSSNQGMGPPNEALGQPRGE